MSGKLTKNHAKYVKSLQQKKFRDQNEEFIAEGEKLVNEALANNQAVKQIIITSSQSQSFETSSLEVITATEREMGSISGLKQAPGILAIIEKPQLSGIPEFSKSMVILESISDPGNLGTIMRICDWFGVDQLCLLGDSVDPFNSKVVQASMGAIFRLNLFEINHADLRRVVDNEMSCFRADLNGDSIYDTAFSEPFALVMGSESHGFSKETQELVKEAITIPKFGSSESLNVGVSTGIILSEIKRKGHS